MQRYPGGQNICGVTIGVLGLDTKYPKLPGHIKNPSAFNFPVLYENVRGATMDKVLNEPEALLDDFIAAAKYLEAEGVRAITGSCGFLARYHLELARAVNIPVFASSLLLIPMVYTMLGRQGSIGVMTANSKALTPDLLKAVGADGIPVAVEGMEDRGEFREVVLEGRQRSLDFGLMENEIRSAAKALKHNNPDIGAVVLECTDISPMAHVVQADLGLPVFDLISLMTMVHASVLRQPYQGVLPPTQSAY